MLVLAAGCFNEKCTFGSVDGCGPGVTGIYGQYTFIGAGTIDDPAADHLHPTALGGYQTISFQREDPDAASVNFIQSSNPIALAVQQKGGTARVHAVGLGTSNLRLFGKNQKELIDEVPIRAVEVLPALRYQRVTLLPSVVATKIPVPIVVDLGDAVDDTAQLEATGGQASVDGPWYRRRVVAAAQATVLTLTARSGAASSEPLTLPIVAAAEELELTNEDKLLAGVLITQGALKICPYATAGGKEILGGTPTMKSIGPVFLVAELPPDEICHQVNVTGVGSAQITLRLGALTRTIDFEVGQPDMQVSTPDDLGLAIDAASDL